MRPRQLVLLEIHLNAPVMLGSIRQGWELCNSYNEHPVVVNHLDMSQVMKVQHEGASNVSL